MTDLNEIKVECHSGYKSDEYPKYFYCDNVWFEVNEILDRRNQGELNTEFTPANYFKVKTNDEKIYILKHEERSDKWFLWFHGESVNL